MIKQYNPEMPELGSNLRRRQALADITEFLKSGEYSAEVEPPADSTPERFYSNLFAAIRESAEISAQCAVRRRKSRIFLIRTDKKGGPADA